MDALKYTNEELEKQLNLLEIHLKQAPTSEEIFCSDCIRKHISTIEGLAEEGIGFSNNPEKYVEIAEIAREIKTKDFKKGGVEIAKKVRQIRKSLSNCPECEEELGSQEKVETIKNLTKNLNTQPSFNNHNLNKIEKVKMVTYMDLAYMNAGQFAAEGARYLSEMYPNYEKYITIGGGIGLQALGLFGPRLRLPAVLNTIFMVAGSNLLAGGIVKLVKGTTATAGMRIRATPTRLGRTPQAGKAIGSTGKTFGGRVTATGVPTQYARAGILATPSAQAYEAPEHADLIRVD